MTNAGGIDKPGLYGVFQKGDDWKQSLNRKAAHKALDIAEDMPINVRNERHGMGWKELLAIGLLGMAGLGTTGGGLLGLGGLAYLLAKQKPPVAEAPAEFTDTDTDTQYEFSISSGRKPAP